MTMTLNRFDDYFISLGFYTYIINEVIALLILIINEPFYSLYFNYDFHVNINLFVYFFCEIGFSTVTFWFFRTYFFSDGTPYKQHGPSPIIFAMFWTLSIAINFYIDYSNGAVAGSVVVSNITFIRELFPTTPWLYGAYYFYGSKSSKNNWVLSIPLILYCLTNLLLGWSGFILAIFTLELVRINYRNGSSLKKTIVEYYLFLITFGAIGYAVIYPLKFFFRGYELSWISVPESLLFLLTRTSNFVSSYYLFCNSDKLITMLQTSVLNTISPYSYVAESIAGFIPRFLWPDKPLFFNLNNVVEIYRVSFETTSNADLSILSKIVFLEKLEVLSGVLFVVYNILILYFLKKLGKRYAPFSNMLIWSIYLQFLTASKVISFAEIVSIGVFFLEFELISILDKYLVRDIQ